MAKSGAQRQREWRKRQKDKKRIDTYIDKEASECLDRIKNELNEETAEALSNALKVADYVRSKGVLKRVLEVRTMKEEKPKKDDGPVRHLRLDELWD